MRRRPSRVLKRLRDRCRRPNRRTHRHQPPRPQAQKPAVQPRTSIFGEWKLDQDDSDDPRKKMQDAQNSQGNGGYGGNRRMGGGYPGGGYPGGGGGGYGGHRMGQQNESDEDRQRMQELLSPSEYAERRGRQERRGGRSV